MAKSVDFENAVRLCSVASAVVVAMTTASAAIIPLSPTDGANVSLVPDAQKAVMSPLTLNERIEFLRKDRENGKVIRHDKYWRRARPIVLKWRTTEKERGPWKIEIGRIPELSDARVWYVRVNAIDAVSGRDTGRAKSEDETSYSVPRANLEIARDYYWRVTARGRCGKWNCGSRCGCKESKRIVRSEISHFRTEDRAPRWIEIEGDVRNIRDFGGWRTEDGHRVRQGMAFRGQGLNNNSVTGERQGRNRLTVEDVKYLTGMLGIRTDLDLRSKGETADMVESPLGPGVTFIQHSAPYYAGIFTAAGKKKMAEIFRTFCNPTNYPIYFHCIGGADRTGSLAYVMLGVLGVSRHDIETDWESTFYPSIPFKDGKGGIVWNSELHFEKGLSKYGNPDDSWNHRIELYLLDCGISPKEIAGFRSIMLE